MARHLFAAADQYSLERLRAPCKAMLCEDVTINTVATLQQWLPTEVLNYILLAEIPNVEVGRLLIIELLFPEYRTVEDVVGITICILSIVEVQRDVYHGDATKSTRQKKLLPWLLLFLHWNTNPSTLVIVQLCSWTWKLQSPNLKLVCQMKLNHQPHRPILYHLNANSSLRKIAEIKL